MKEQAKDRRTTIILPTALDKNLEALALLQDVGKGEIIRRALIEYVRAAGLHPQKLPNVEISYK